MTPVSRSRGTEVRRGIVFPQDDLVGGPDVVREYVEEVQELGFDHLVLPEHVLGADPSLHPGWAGVYDVDDTFHEPFVLLGFLSAFSTIELVTGVLVLPQRQTALVAKQAAEVELLSGGRLRLGVGIGWNRPEFEGMAADFSSRGRRIDEQIALMRRIWSERSITFDGEYHHLHGVGIAPLPQRAIPVWLGAEKAIAALERAGRIGDGWMAMGPPGAQAYEAYATVMRAAETAGRDPDAIGVQAWVNLTAGDVAQTADEIAEWRRIGATHIAVNTRSHTRPSLEENLDRIKQAAHAFDRAA
jgi:probable F420-dependent oxidoreductase